MSDSIRLIFSTIISTLIFSIVLGILVSQICINSSFNCGIIVALKGKNNVQVAKESGKTVYIITKGKLDSNAFLFPDYEIMALGIFFVALYLVTLVNNNLSIMIIFVIGVTVSTIVVFSHPNLYSFYPPAYKVNPYLTFICLFVELLIVVFIVNTDLINKWGRSMFEIREPVKKEKEMITELLTGETIKVVVKFLFYSIIHHC